MPQEVEESIVFYIEEKVRSLPDDFHDTERSMLEREAQATRSPDPFLDGRRVVGRRQRHLRRKGLMIGAAD